MNDLSAISSELIVQSFSSAVCPACSGSKKERLVVCHDCWDALPHSIRRHLRLYKPNSEEHKNVVLHVMKALGKEQFHMAPEEDVVNLPDAQARNLVLGAIGADKRTTILALKELHLPFEQLTRMITELADSGEIAADPLEDDGVTIPAFRRIDAFASQAVPS